MSQNEMSNLKTILAKVFEFSPADVAANRKGEISAAQKARITKTHYANSRFAWIIFALIFGLGLAGGSADMIRTGNMGIQFLLMYFSVTAFFGVIVWAFILYYRHQMKRTLREGSVQSVQGKIQIIRERVEKRTRWYFCVGHHRFKIKRLHDGVLLQKSGIAGRNARVYFSEPWHSLLSVVLQG